MKKSKLEAYQDILNILSKKPMTIDTLSYQAKTDCTILRQRLNSLIDYGLVSKRNSDKTLFAITERGAAVSRALDLQKHLQRVKNAIAQTEENLRTMPTTSLRQNRRDENWQ